MKYIYVHVVFIALFSFNQTSSIDPDWWKHMTIYQIFVASFKDSNGDGIGDLNGITSKLNYLEDLGIDCLYLTPFFKSGPNYAGYDVSNYTEIQPTYGTMRDFEQLIRAMKRRGMKLIIDLVINHSGKEHEWFSKSQERNGKYTDYYVWADAKGYNQGQPVPPNNWRSVFGSSAWTWSHKRGQFYLHQFIGDQPDLNLRCESLKEEIKQIIAYWIDKGVSGIRLDAAQYFVEDAQLRDEPQFIYTINTQETFEVIHEFRTFSDDYANKNNKEICIYLVECISANDEEIKRYHGRPDYPIAHFPFNFRAFGIHWFEAKQFDDIVTNWLKMVPTWSVANWMVENQDSARLSNRYCEEYSFVLTTAIMTLPGIAIIYYGQEIPLSGYGPPGVNFDKPERLPMQWDSSSNAGFTTNRQPWLPVHSNYWRANVAIQQRQKFSWYNTFKKLLRLRMTTTLRKGELKTYPISTWVYAFVRSHTSRPSFVTVLNFGVYNEPVNLRDQIHHLPEYLKTEVASPNSGYRAENVVNTLCFIMKPLSSLVLTTKV